MTPRRRIALNVVATYGRSLYSLVCGLFTARWVIWFLGDIDYGLYGVVGGLTAFVTFLNGLLAAAVGRFYAYAVGEAKKPGNDASGLEECRRWFTMAAVLHTAIPLVLVAIGYPVGAWAIRNFLVIPADRVETCIWVWRWVMLACFVAMANVPYQAMYTAKQNIAELTIYSFATTTLNVFVLYYMVRNRADWLSTYAAWMMLMNVIPQVIICIRAFYIYPECRFRFSALKGGKYLKPILSFAGCRLVNGMSMIAANQGQSIVVNKYLGPIANTSIAVGNQVSSHAQSLASSLSGAMYPAITNAAGEGRMDDMRKMALWASKFSALSLLVFLVPLSLEMDYILKVWLVRPIPSGAPLCVLVLVASLMDRSTEGCWMAIFAVGKIARYQLIVPLAGFIMLGLGWLFVCHGGGVASVGLALVTGSVATQFFRLYYGSRIAGLSIRTWFSGVFLPVVFLAAVSSAAGAIPRFLMAPSMFRVVATTGLSVAVFAVFVWFVVLGTQERMYFRSRFRFK